MLNTELGRGAFTPPEAEIMPMTLNIAMIATGGIADKQLAPALGQAPNAQLWNVFSRDKDRAAAFAGKHGAAAESPAYDDLDALLADPDLDAVLIASPDKLHADQAVRAARAGKHILTEKPMATDRKGSAAMVEAADQAGVRLAVAYHMRWHMGHRALFEAAQSGAFGTLRHMRIQWPTPARNADGWRAKADVGRWWALAAVGTHCLDQIRWFMRPSCGEITSAKSIINRAVYGGPHDETALSAFQFENGATAELCVSVLFRGPRVIELYGSDGYAICTETLGPRGDGRIETHEGVFEYTPANPYVGEIEDFAAAIRDGRAPEVDGAEGAANVDLLLKAIDA
ncbi:MAG: Gfo/Idh/MocA family oxidoreductase [Pseudomonadota bacterium]